MGSSPVVWVQYGTTGIPMLQGVPFWSQETAAVMAGDGGDAAASRQLAITRLAIATGSWIYLWLNELDMC